MIVAPLARVTGEALSAKPIFGPDFEPYSGVIHKSQFCWKAASGIWLFWNKNCQMAETGEMVGASFLSICVTVGAASFGPPKTRNLLSSALPFNVVARPTHTEPTGNPPRTQQEPAWESERNPRGAHGSLPGTHQEPTPNRI